MELGFLAVVNRPCVRALLFDTSEKQNRCSVFMFALKLNLEWVFGFILQSRPSRSDFRRAVRISSPSNITGYKLFRAILMLLHFMLFCLANYEAQFTPVWNIHIASGKGLTGSFLLRVSRPNFLHL